MTSSALKWIALITMIVDHVAVCAQNSGWGPIADSTALYLWMRGIGRIAFPIYCFLLANGMRYTHNRTRYFLRLLGCAALSQLPFTAALYAGEWQYTGILTLFRHWNVLVTLALGCLLCGVWEDARTKPFKDYAVRAALCGVALVALGLDLWDIDYGFMGVLLILLLFAAQERKTQALLLLLWGLVEYLPLMQLPFMLVLLAAGAVWCYNGRQGRPMKWFFYLSYPVHLAVLAAAVWLPLL